MPGVLPVSEKSGSSQNDVMIRVTSQNDVMMTNNVSMAKTTDIYTRGESTLGCFHALYKQYTCANS